MNQPPPEVSPYVPPLACLAQEIEEKPRRKALGNLASPPESAHYRPIADALEEPWRKKSTASPKCSTARSRVRNYGEL
jgi:hypothetical protein